MGILSKKLRDVWNDGEAVGFWCPGCKRMHIISVGSEHEPRWDWDDNVDAPTFNPSIKVTHPHWVPSATPENMNPGPQTQVIDICHSFVRAGQIQFLEDCTHELRGQTVPLPDLPEGYAE